jgi:hypothetical protein
MMLDLLFTIYYSVVCLSLSVIIFPVDLLLSLSCALSTDLAVLWILDVLVRIRISGSVPLTNGSGSGRPKNIRIRIRNTGFDLYMEDIVGGLTENHCLGRILIQPLLSATKLTSVYLLVRERKNERAATYKNIPSVEAKGA